MQRHFITLALVFVYSLRAPIICLIIQLLKLTTGRRLLTVGDQLDGSAGPRGPTTCSAQAHRAINRPALAAVKSGHDEEAGEQRTHGRKAGANNGGAYFNVRPGCRDLKGV